MSELESSASRRRFAIPQVLADEIATHIKRHRPDAAQSDPLFIGSRGGIMRRSFTGRTFKDAVRRAALPETLNFHGLRHVATSLMVANNEHPRVIQHRLGHADPHISMTVYAHVSPDLDRAAARRLDNVLAPGPPATKQHHH